MHAERSAKNKSGCLMAAAFVSITDQEQNCRHQFAVTNAACEARLGADDASATTTGAGALGAVPVFVGQIVPATGHCVVAVGHCVATATGQAVGVTGHCVGTDVGH